MFFKGYIETAGEDGKTAVESFKNKTEFKTFEQVQSLKGYAGVLAPETVLVDIDDFDQSEILLQIVKDKDLKCQVIKTTRGKHFLFKNTILDKNRTHCKLAIGLEADIKLGCRNSYEVRKVNGVAREIIHDTAESEEADPLPRYLLPVKTKADFLNLGDGDGRNQELFNYILTLQSNDYSVEEARETIRIINKYVLKVPLSDQELEVILRDDSFKKPTFFNGSSFLFDKFAVYLKNNAHILKINNQLHIYKNGIYIPNTGDIEAEMIKRIPNLRRSNRAEVLAYLDVLIRDNVKAEDANLIAFKNGLYNILDGSFQEFAPEHIITNMVPWNYNPNSYSQLADNVLNNLSCNDKQVRALLEECIGYCFYRQNELGKAFILTGDKSNGKSTFLSMVQNLLGEDNISSLDLKELGDRFKTAEMFGKLANIGDDIGEEFIPNPAIFKKLVTGERVSAERKGRDPFEFNNYSKMLFSANNIPRIKDKTGAVMRRLVIIPFDAQFKPGTAGFDAGIKYKLKSPEVMEYLINLGLDALERILERQAFTSSRKVQKAMEEYEENNNPILGFFRECEDEEFQIENEPTRKVYDHYKEYCLANSLQAMSSVEFSRQVSRILGMETVNRRINGKQYRIFVRR